MTDSDGVYRRSVATARASLAHQLDDLRATAHRLIVGLQRFEERDAVPDAEHLACWDLEERLHEFADHLGGATAKEFELDAKRAARTGGVSKQ